MGQNTTREAAAACAYCAGPMPPPAAHGRLAIYCSGACRKAAYDARRARKPGAFQVKVVVQQATIEHDLGACVEHVIASPAACRRVLQELARMVREQQISDPRWDSTRAAFATLTDAIAAGQRAARGHR